MCVTCNRHARSATFCSSRLITTHLLCVLLQNPLLPLGFSIVRQMPVSIATHSVLPNALRSVIDSTEFRSVIDQINRVARASTISGLVAEPARALVLAALQRETRKQFAIVMPAQRDLESWERDLNFWYCAVRGVSQSEQAITVLPASESDPYAGGSPHAETLERRALALWRLARGPRDFVLL